MTTTRGLYITRWNIGLRTQAEADELLRFAERHNITDLMIHNDRGDAGTRRRNFDYCEYISTRHRSWLWWSEGEKEKLEEALSRYPQFYGLHIEKKLDAAKLAEGVTKPVSYNVCRTSKLYAGLDAVALVFANYLKGFLERLSWAKSIGAKAVVFPLWAHYLPKAKEHLSLLEDVTPYFYFYHPEMKEALGNI